MRGNVTRGGSVCKGLVAVVITLATSFFWAHTQSVPGQPIASQSPSSGQGAAPKSSWETLDALLGDNKLAEAAAVAETICLDAQSRGENAQWTRALIKEFLILGGWRGSAEAVRLIQRRPWPGGSVNQALLNLFYAKALTSYLDVERYRSNTRATSKGGNRRPFPDWSTDEFRDEILQSYLSVWLGREALGAVKIDSLQEYIQPNTYPPGVRDTLRDAFSYWFAQFLVDRDFWTDDQSRIFWKMAAEPLLITPDQAHEAGMHEVAFLKDPANHPLSKMASVMTDLEGWHRSAGQIEGQLEAHLARLQFIDDDRGAWLRQPLVADLTRCLPAFRSLPWWAQGQAVLAQWIQEEKAPDNLVRAREAALQGKKAYPRSVGGMHCAEIVSDIERPSLHLYGMTDDGPAHRSVKIDYTNMSRVYFRAYAWDADAKISRDHTLDYSPSEKEVWGLLKGARPVKQWRVDLPPAEDYKSHWAYDVPPLPGLGTYVVVGSTGRGFRDDHDRIVSLALNLTDLVAVGRTGTHREAEVIVLDGATGTPVGGAEVSLYEKGGWNSPDEKVSSVATGPDGVARFGPVPDDDERYSALVRRGQSFAVVEISSGRTYSDRKGPIETLLYTDRNAYRPGQKICYKAIAVKGDWREGDLQALSRQPVKIELRDANRSIVGTSNATTNEFGSVAGEMEIPTGKMLGSWTLSSNLDGDSWIRVEEYKRPTFEVTLKDPKEPPRLGHPVTIVGETRYYFGSPVRKGSVKWSVHRENVYPRWDWEFAGEYAGGDLIAEGKSPLKPDGAFEIRFTAESDVRYANSSKVTYSFSVRAEVTDEGGETREGRRDFGIGASAISANLQFKGAFFQAARPIEFTVTRRDLDEIPRAGEGTWTMVRLLPPDAVVLPADQPLPHPWWYKETGDEGPRVTATPGDSIAPRWRGDTEAPSGALAHWTEGVQVTSGTLEHGADGKASATIQALPPGVYRFHYQTADPFGEVFTTSREMVVAGPDLRLPVPIFLMVDRSIAFPGETCQLLVHSGFAGQQVHLDIFRKDVLAEHRVITSHESPQIIELPIGDEDRGGVTVRLWMFRDWQPLEEQIFVQVPWRDKELKVDFDSIREVIRPGESEHWKISVEDSAGKGLEADQSEILAYMYDRSLDLIKEETPPSILSLYPKFAHPNRSSQSVQVDYGNELEDGSGKTFHGTALSGDRLQMYLTFSQARNCGAAEVQGRVMDESGQPVIGAMVQLVGPALTHGFVGAATDTEGVYCINGAPPGKNYQVRVEAPGYNTVVRKGIEVIKGTVLHLPFTLSQGKTEIVVTAAAPTIQDMWNSSSESSYTVNGVELESPKDYSFSGRPDRSTGLQKLAARQAGPRKDFRETAFFLPNLVNGPGGKAALEFSVPDSVTSWNVWVHASTRDMHGGSDHRIVRSRKDLMVRPYLPRFFREGDRTRILVAVQNASEDDAEGNLEFTIKDPATGRDLGALFGLPQGVGASKHFSAKAGETSIVPFDLRVPPNLSEVLVRASATAGRLADGEEHRIPVLPSRMFLALSRSVTLKENETKVLAFPEEASNNDSTLAVDRLVVSADAQLFEAAIAALPYLVRYPFECTEQTLNRFLSTGILESLFAKYPSIEARMAEASKRSTPLQAWDTSDPNLILKMEETPWLLESSGKTGWDGLYVNVLKPGVAKQQREQSLAKLLANQDASGGFPWWAGGPPSPYMTIYVLHGIASGMAFGLEGVPSDRVQKAWRYLSTEQLPKWLDKTASDPEAWRLATCLNFVYSQYKGPTYTGNFITSDQRRALLDLSMKHQQEMPVLLQSLLAMTLMDMEREGDARVVLEGIMSSAVRGRDGSLSWQDTPQPWRWSEDTVETHAYALEALLDISPGDPRAEGLVQWLFLNRKLDHWSSTKSTAEVLHALATYFNLSPQDAHREEVKVVVGPRTETFSYGDSMTDTGKRRLAIDGSGSTMAQLSPVSVSKSGRGLAFASATWHFSTENPPGEEQGDLFAIERSYFKRDGLGESAKLVPLSDDSPINIGDEIEVHLIVKSAHPAEFVYIRDPRASGFEPCDVRSGYHWNSETFYYQETRDSGTNFFVEWLPQGKIALTYSLRATIAGTFRTGPATVQSMYAPEFNAYSKAAAFKIEPLIDRGDKP